MATRTATLTIGEVVRRSGVAHSALRFYEQRGLVHAQRTAGNQRRYPRDVLRRLAFIRAAQRVGLSLDDIGAALARLPEGRTPTRRDWQRLSNGWHAELEARIDGLLRLRDRLTDCIGCGCLSLDTCWLYNPNDEMAEHGTGSAKLRPAADGGIG